MINTSKTFEKQHSIRKIKDHRYPNSVFSFDDVTKAGFEEEIRLPS